MRDLGTLGGTDANALIVNDCGQVTGWSFTNLAPSTNCFFPLTTDPFLWENGTMTDLGTLGGTCGFPNWLNNQGDVVGQSNLAGDSAFHPFLWRRGRIRDLGTLGGNFGSALSISEARGIVGWATTPGDQAVHGFLWKRDRMSDLGVISGTLCSKAYAVNSKREVVGSSDDDCFGANAHAFLWEGGGPMVDLNSLIPPGSSLELTFAYAINDRGEIVGSGVPPGCAPKDVGICGHAYVLIPCGEGEDCGNSAAGTAATQSSPAPVTQRPSTATPANPALSGRGLLDRFRTRRFPWYRVPAPGTGPAN